MRRLPAICVGVTLLAVPMLARAEPCGRPDWIAAFPDDGATGVPLDASLSAVYSPTADHLGESVILQGPLGDAELSASFDRAEHRLIVEPGPLLPGAEYRVTWPELRGLTTAAPGLGREVLFTTGNANDQGAPEFDGIRALGWDIHHVDDDCTDDLEPRFRFDLRLATATDDAASSLSLLVFQTRGPGLGADPKLVALRPYPLDRRLSLELGVAATTGRVCFAAVARDLRGAVSASGHRERCVETTAPPFFYGCSVGAARTRRAGAPAAFVLLALLLCRRARRGSA